MHKGRNPNRRHNSNGEISPKESLLTYIFDNCKNATSEDRDGLPVFNYNHICNTILRGYTLSEATSLLADLLAFLPEYLLSRPHPHLYSFKGVTKPVAHSVVLFQLLLCVLAPSQRPASDGSTWSPVKANSEQEATDLSEELTLSLLYALLPLHFPNEYEKVWSRIIYLLKLKKRCSVRFVSTLVSAVTEGRASFAATKFVMRDDLTREHVTDPTVLRVALCSGALDAKTVEAFAANRPKEFRDKCRSILLEAEQVAQSPGSFRQFCPVEVSAGGSTWSEQQFAENVTRLMQELRLEKQHDFLIHDGWARTCIKKLLKKTYIDKDCDHDRLHEILWTILCQRPHLRRMLVDWLEMTYADPEYATYWRRANFKLNAIRNVATFPNGVVPRTRSPNADPMLPVSNYLNFPPELNDIVFVCQPEQVARICEDFEATIRQCGSIRLALDAEWSAYQGYSTASLLQIATSHRVYLVDIDALPFETLDSFMQLLFGSNKVLKIGFHFHEDLQQLKNAMTGCLHLYRPQNLHCITKMIKTLVTKSASRSDFEDILRTFGLYDQIQPPVEDSPTKGGEPRGPAQNLVAGADRVLLQGLSALCERMLGAPLNKSEQCSAWTRRPLRPSQVRYAAMDASCLLMLYKRCAVWAERIGLPLTDLHNEQSGPSKIPLFLGD